MRREMRPRAGFRVRRRGEVTGHGSFVLPVKQKARMLSLALQEAEIVEDCITKQGIRLNVRAVAAFKVGDDPASALAQRVTAEARPTPTRRGPRRCGKGTRS